MHRAVGDPQKSEPERGPSTDDWASASGLANDMRSEQDIRAQYEQAETDYARVFEELVAKRGFGWVFARSAENVAALVRISADVSDLMLRNLRLAGRADVTRLSRQLHRTEDKLERVLQEVEALRDELAHRPSARGANGQSAPVARSAPVTRSAPVARRRSGAQP